MEPTPDGSLLLLARLIREHGAGIGLASGLTLLMLTLCFAVGHRLRPRWGLGWLGLSMAAAGVRGAAAAAGLLTPAWRLPLALVTAVGLAALVVGLRRFVGRHRWPPMLEFAGVFLLWQAVTQAARSAGLGPIAGVLTTTGIYLYLAALCLPALKAVTGRAHALAAGALVVHPLIVVGLGVGLMGLDALALHSWSVMSQGLLGLGLLTAAAGRLLIELQAELQGRQQAEARLRQLNDSLEQRIQARTEELEGLVDGLDSFNRMVSHDLRGPLGGLAGVALLAREALAQQDIPRAEQMLGLIQTETSRLSSLVTQLLMLARISNSELALQITPLDEVLQRALQSLSLSVGSAQVAQVHPEPLPQAEVDADLVQQVFVNLIGNALKFSQGRAHPEVRVRESAPGPRGAPAQVVVEVRDNGPGFDTLQANQLFQPFKRLHGRAFEGHGIGLTIVRRIVERHGGRVWAEGRPGQGASFFFSLPAGAEGRSVG